LARCPDLTCKETSGGGQFPSPASAISSNGWRSVIDLNLNGTFICCREVFAATFGEKGGNIVNIICGNLPLRVQARREY